MSSPHDRGYFPPIPVLSVKFGRSGERPWLGPFEAIVDTGADTTILPDSVVEQLKITPIIFTIMLYNIMNDHTSDLRRRHIQTAIMMLTLR